MGTRKHQKFRIGGFLCQIRIFPDDPSIVQGFCEVQEVENFSELFVSPLLLDFPEILVSGLFKVLMYSELPLPDLPPKS